MPCFFNQCTPIKASHKSTAVTQKGSSGGRQRPEFLQRALKESTPTNKVVLPGTAREITPMKKTNRIERKPRSISSPDMSKKRTNFIRRGLRFSSSVSKSKDRTEKLSVVLDLDETLVHSRFVNKDDGSIRQRERRKTATVATNEFILNIGDETIRVNRRPGLKKFLAEASELFNLYIFTAAIEDYARPVIDYLDPKKNIFSGRFYRGSCFQMPNRTYAKDLFHVCDDLKRVVLVDNNCNSFALQKSNGIPISSFYDDASDIALIKLMKFLKYLTKVQDVRPRLKSLFNVCEVPRRKALLHTQVQKKNVEKKSNHRSTSKKLKHHSTSLLSEKENVSPPNKILSTTSV